MLFAELPLLDDDGNTTVVWVNMDNVVAVLDFDGRVRLAANNNTEVATVDLDVTATDLLRIITARNGRMVDLASIEYRMQHLRGEQA